MKLTSRTVPIIGICLAIATCFMTPANAHVPAPSPLTDDPFASAPVQKGGDLPSPLADDPYPNAPTQTGGDPPMTPVSLVGVFDVMDYGAVADGKTDSSTVHSRVLRRILTYHNR